ncbi:MAG: 3-phosphoshikimate 1-carboxyvinyltransferase, partial [Oscillospiraceae bacterium]
EATINCLCDLGCNIEIMADRISVFPIDKPVNMPFLNCYESGSTLRFLLPVVAALGVNPSFLGTGKLPYRPLEPLLSQMKKHGVTFYSETLPTTLTGKMTGGVFEIAGNVSSQFITGLLLALPLLEGGGKIKLLSPLQSKSYVDITLEVMRDFGIYVKQTSDEYSVAPDSKYISPKELTAPGDWSNAAFWLCNGALNETTICTGLDFKSSQGDKAIVDILKNFGAKVEIGANYLSVSPCGRTPLCIDASNIPDIIPVISVLLSVADGVSKISNVDRLRLKECDRVNAILELLASLGCNAEYGNNEIIIFGQKKLCGGTVTGYNDHRIVMSAAIASTLCDGEVKITDALAINKSYPQFFEDFKRLGGNVNVF